MLKRIARIFTNSLKNKPKDRNDFKRIDLEVCFAKDFY
jgi:hypothetical protein